MSLWCMWSAVKEVEQKLEKNGRGKRRQTSGGKGREESREKKKYEENIDGTNWAP